MKISKQVQGTAIALSLVAFLASGCNKQQSAIDAAKADVVKTGQPQEVIYTDGNGMTTTTLISPPAAGTTTPGLVSATAPVTAPSAPVTTAPAAIPQGAGNDEVIKKIDDLMWHTLLSDIAHIDKIEYTSLPPARIGNPRAPGAGNPLIIRAYTFIPKNLDRSRKQPPCRRAVLPSSFHNETQRLRIASERWVSHEQSFGSTNHGKHIRPAEPGIGDLWTEGAGRL